MITVYCDSLTLTDFPTSIPINTTTIHLEDNRISNTKALEDNLAYSKVADVYLDNNLVSSIDNLEGSNWFTQFRILSLRFNKLTSVSLKIAAGGGSSIVFQFEILIFLFRNLRFRATL